jgi:centromeric protein E
LVDLAGSEKLTDNEARNKEASYIKKSLLALQSVVSSLTELGTSTSSSNQSNTSSSNQSSNTSNPSNNKQKLLHVPYRNSQLTRLLQTSLSGNAKVAFLCTISPEPESDVETLSTLRFAAAAKKVETRAEMGQVVDRATLLEALESKVLELEAALMTNADYTEALERERDEAIERADGAEKTCDDVSPPLIFLTKKEGLFHKLTLHLYLNAMQSFSFL